MSSKTLRRPEAFYWPRHGFYTRNRFGEWVNTDKETVRMKMIRAGFTITHVEDWGPTDEQITARPELAEEKERPMMLLVAAHR